MSNELTRIVADLRTLYGADVPDPVLELIGHCDLIERRLMSKEDEVGRLNHDLSRIRGELQHAAAVLKAGYPA